MAQYLVIQLARFGDLVQTKRLMLTLLAEEGATVHLAVDRSLYVLAQLLYPGAIIHGIEAHAGGTSAATVLVNNRVAFARLGECSFTAVYNLNFSPLSLALSALFPHETIKGHRRNNGQAQRSRWCGAAFRWTGERRLAPLNLVDYWAYFHPKPIAPHLVNLTPSGGDTRRMAVVLAGREARRSIPVELLARILEMFFHARDGITPILIGSEQERPLARRLLRLLRPPVADAVLDLSGATALPDLPDLLRGCGCILTPDTGVMHLAAHLGVNVYGVFLSSAWCFETGPYGAGHTVWQSTLNCAPCVESVPCPVDVACLEAFSHKGFLARLAGTPSRDWPRHLMEVTSHCDELGVTYKPVRGEYAEARQHDAIRRHVAELVGVALPDASDNPPLPAWASTLLMHERDWLLPGF